ncbi:hypothetical protein PISMIDRAFT_687403 [Pisolithus microcarpus 441]|uniref:Uncharacterized protein n=1 Tax=Pisolithus microcarpus 441 TaxID=765257 RepID=A0A0C9YMZ8_9AGAM|nr:hypothetical protein BKA83DRAFT_687403 [Pisolithus microcarpus]KIK15289.1 hypothetical protein PISMIDRAFT_687403 [Pisolithus microcarpus 441]
MIPVLLHRCATPRSQSSSSPSSGKSIYIPRLVRHHSVVDGRWYTGSPKVFGCYIKTGSWSITTSLAQSQWPSVKLGQRAVFLSNRGSSLPDGASQPCRVFNTVPSIVCSSRGIISRVKHLDVRDPRYATPDSSTALHTAAQRESVHREFTVWSSVAGAPRQS